jgi:hypothetical protein
MNKFQMAVVSRCRGGSFRMTTISVMGQYEPSRRTALHLNGGEAGLKTDDAVPPPPECDIGWFTDD